MKVNELTVLIDRPIDEVFLFSVDPANTPIWVGSIVEEKTNEWPIKLGTVYENQNQAGEWSKYKVVSFDKNKLFKLESSDGTYCVEYTYSIAGDNKTKLVYRELVKEGELDKPFTQRELDLLKEAIEI